MDHDSALATLKRRARRSLVLSFAIGLAGAVVLRYVVETYRGADLSEAAVQTVIFAAVMGVPLALAYYFWLGRSQRRALQTQALERVEVVDTTHSLVVAKTDGGELRRMTVGPIVRLMEPGEVLWVSPFEASSGKGVALAENSRRPGHPVPLWDVRAAITPEVEEARA